MFKHFLFFFFFFFFKQKTAYEIVPCDWSSDVCSSDLQAEVWEKLLALPLPDVPSFALIVTRGHRHDALVLKEWIHKPFLFLGMIGSSRKARTIFEHFNAEKIATAEELKRVACPVGIKIRSQSVEEI